jgi:ATP-binding cassette subfamily B (MDR/TAP) protein 1
MMFIIVFYCCNLTIPFLVRGLKEVEYTDRMSSSIASEVFESIRMVFACGVEQKLAEKYAG